MLNIVVRGDYEPIPIYVLYPVVYYVEGVVKRGSNHDVAQPLLNRCSIHRTLGSPGNNAMNNCFEHMLWKTYAEFKAGAEWPYI